uniref:Calpain, small subunit 1 a n=1 Tax=Labrus bergylta TaxID=56723 RepID=A0A3Q3H3A6_9LABR
MFFAKQFLSGVINVVSNIDPAQFVPSEPPPPRRPAVFAEAHESDEEKQFRRVFQQLAGEDMEVSPNELMNILNRIVSKRGDLKTDGFSIESCRSMVAVMDSDSTGKLGFHEFKQLWNNIKKWQEIYKSYDADGSGVIGADELPKAFTAAGFPLNDQLFHMIIRRYSDEGGNMDFDNYIGCLVRLDAMCLASADHVLLRPDDFSPACHRELLCLSAPCRIYSYPYNSPLLCQPLCERRFILNAMQVC